jgi:hypothetical protein
MLSDDVAIGTIDMNKLDQVRLKRSLPVLIEEGQILHRGVT